MGNTCKKQESCLIQIPDNEAASPTSSQVDIPERFPSIEEPSTKKRTNSTIPTILQSYIEVPETDDIDESPLRLKNIFAKHVNTQENYERPIYSKSESEATSIENVLSTNFIFSSLDVKDRTHIFDAFEKSVVSKDEHIIREGDVGDYFYVIEKGNVDFYIKGNKINSAGEGSSFGDLALIYNCPRTASCISRETCILWRLDQRTYRQMLANNAMENETTKRSRLEKLQLMESVSKSDINKIASAASTINVSKGKTIIQKGETSGDFYVIHQGHVTIKEIEAGGKTFEDQTLGPGEYFGELASLRNEPRTATVMALEDVVLLSISHEVFMRVVGPLKELIIKANDLRRLKAIPRFAISDITDSEYRSLISHVRNKKLDAGSVLMKEKSQVSGAIYLVRKGAITITSSEPQAQTNTTISDGGYFGEQTMHIQSHETNLSAVAATKTEVGIIGFKDIQSVIQDMSRLHAIGSKKTSLDKSIQLSNLKKHRILGIGTFGEVWLVSSKNNNKKKLATYALKVQGKRHLLKNEFVEDAKREAKIMTLIDHPFIVKLISLYQDKNSIMMLLELVQGGELLNIMKFGKRFFMVPEHETKFYSCCVLEALIYLHHRDIVYRDLKPENVLISLDGYVVIVDMGFAKVVKQDKTFTLCGTPFYMAPEVIIGKGHDKGCDYWSWAILVHQMLSGMTPFHGYRGNQIDLLNAIVRGKSRISPAIHTDAKDLIERILVGNPSLRLGCLARGEMDIKSHRFFNDMDFNKLLEKKVNAPWIPDHKDALDCSKFDEWDEKKIKKRRKNKRAKPLTCKEQKLFTNFENIP